MMTLSELTAAGNTVKGRFRATSDSISKSGAHWVNGDVTFELRDKKVAVLRVGADSTRQRKAKSPRRQDGAAKPTTSRSSGGGVARPQTSGNSTQTS